MGKYAVLERSAGQLVVWGRRMNATAFKAPRVGPSGVENDNALAGLDKGVGTTDSDSTRMTLCREQASKVVSQVCE